MDDQQSLDGDFSDTSSPILRHRMDKEERERFRRFCAHRSSLAALFTLAISTTLLCIHLLNESLSESTLQTGNFVLRVCRLFATVPVWWVAVKQYKNRGCCITEAPEPIESTALDILSFMSNQSILLFALVGSGLLIYRSYIGDCAKDQHRTMCNPRAEDSGLPADTMLALTAGIIVMPVVLKAHDAMYAFIGYGITCLGFLIAIIIAEASYDAPLLVAYLAAIGLCLYDYEQSLLNVFLASTKAREYYLTAIRNAEQNISTKIENEQMCMVLGNVSHDLKTPLQSFMSEVDNLKRIHQKIFLDSAAAAEVSTIQKYKQENLDITKALESVYSFIMLAINRSEDFSKLKAGIVLQPRTGTFSVSDATDSMVSMVTGCPINVHLLVLHPSSRTLDTVVGPASPMFLRTDKNWYCENLLSLVSNALKFTMDGSVEVEYRLVSLARQADTVADTDTDTTEQLPVIFIDRRVEDLFVDAASVPTRRREVVSASTVITASPASTASAPGVKLANFVKSPPLVSEINDVHQSPHVSTTSTITTATASFFPCYSSSLSQYLLVLVRDTGIGIPSDKKQRLFQPFQQSEKGTGGTGLGLFSAAQRMKALGGHCGVQDREDGSRGVCFWLAYPYKPVDESSVSSTVEAAAAAVTAPSMTSSRSGAADLDNHHSAPYQRPSSDDAGEQKVNKQQTIALSVGSAVDGSMFTAMQIALKSQQHKQQQQQKRDVDVSAAAANCNRWPPLSSSFWKRVLVVDDSPLILKTMSRMLTKEGFDVEVAQNGVIGLQMMEGKEYLFVLSDIQMPVMDGTEMVRKLRTFEERRLLSVSGTDISSNDGDGERPDDAGAVDGAAGASYPPDIEQGLRGPTRRHSRQLLIGMSGNNFPSIETQAIEAGMDCFLPKPILKMELKNCLFNAYQI